MPNFTDELEKGDSDYRHTDVLLAVKWFDKRDVTILSTIHEERTISTEKSIGELPNKFKSQSRSSTTTKT